MWLLRDSVCSRVNAWHHLVLLGGLWAHELRGSPRLTGLIAPSGPDCTVEAQSGSVSCTKLASPSFTGCSCKAIQRKTGVELYRWLRLVGARLHHGGGLIAPLGPARTPIASGPDRAPIGARSGPDGAVGPRSGCDCTVTPSFAVYSYKAARGLRLHHRAPAKNARGKIMRI